MDIVVIAQLISRPPATTSPALAADPKEAFKARFQIAEFIKGRGILETSPQAVNRGIIEADYIGEVKPGSLFLVTAGDAPDLKWIALAPNDFLVRSC